jgi:hypothetical protein
VRRRARIGLRHGGEGSPCDTAAVPSMTDEQINVFAERLVLSFEKVALALEGLNETYRRQFAKQYPERREVREAIVTRVPTREDKIREEQGASDRPLSEWLSDIEDEEESAGADDIGVREREWLAAQRRIAGAEENS